MAIYYLSGYDETAEIGRRKKGGGLFKKGGLKKAFQKIKGKVAKVGLAPARGAFLTLVSLNALKLAKKLAKAWQRNPEKVKSFWQKFGGDPDKLKNAIIKGSKTQIQGIGFALESAIATATPIIIAATKIFKELNVPDEKDANGMNLESATEQGKQTLVEQGATTEQSELPEGSKMAIKTTQPQESSDTTATAKTTTQSEGGSGTGTGSNTALLIGGGAAALLLMGSLKKNK